MKKYFEKWYNSQENKPPYIDGKEFAKKAWNAAVAECSELSNWAAKYSDDPPSKTLKRLKWK